MLGNHDTEVTETKKILSKLGLINIEHRIIDFGKFQLTGVGDRWEGADKPFIQIPNKPTLMVAHNPDSTIEFDSQKINLVLAGHTHCGQIRIPLLYKKVIPTCFGHDCGLEPTQARNGIIPVYISAGVGEIGLPMRLFNPPTIDILQLTP